MRMHPHCMDGIRTVKRTESANSPKVSMERKQCGLTTIIIEKKRKKKARYTAGRSSGKRPSRTPKETVIALPPFAFCKNGKACPTTGAIRTGVKRSECTSKKCCPRKTGRNPLPRSRSRAKIPHKKPPYVKALATPGLWS